MNYYLITFVFIQLLIEINCFIPNINSCFVPNINSCFVPNINSCFVPKIKTSFDKKIVLKKSLIILRASIYNKNKWEPPEGYIPHKYKKVKCEKPDVYVKDIFKKNVIIFIINKILIKIEKIKKNVKNIKKIQ